MAQKNVTNNKIQEKDDDIPKTSLKAELKKIRSEHPDLYDALSSDKFD